MRHLAECLKSVQWADAIVVLHAGEDEPRIPERRPSVLTVRKLVPGEELKSLRGETRTDWVLHLLGEERVEPELSDELPGWFIRNKWYQYIYVAYSAGESPGASSVCTAGSDCLVLDIIDPDTDTAIAGIGRDDIRAMLVYTGSELSGQSQANGEIEDYLDDADNVDQDDNFEKNEKSAASNDLFRLATSCPAPNGDQLCWTR